MGYVGGNGAGKFTGRVEGSEPGAAVVLCDLLRVGQRSMILSQDATLELISVSIDTQNK